MNHYETVFILNPVLSDIQIKETVKKYEELLVSKGAKMVSKEDWGLKKLAYPIQNKKSGFYHLFEFTAPGEAIGPLEVEFRRDERFMRYLTVTLDKHANTSAASIPIALDYAINVEKKIKVGDCLLFEAIGGGLTWGAALIKY